MATILSTKKLKTNQRELVLNAGVSFVEYDAIEIKPVPFSLPLNAENIIITSQNGAKALLNSESKIQDSDFFCVGEKTAALLKNNGFNVAETGKNSADLGKIIVEKYRVKSFHYLCGNKRRDELPKLLEQTGIICNDVVVYETHLIEKQFEQDFDAILFFSPSGVQSFIQANYPQEMTVERLRSNRLENDTAIDRASRLSVGNISKSRAICIGSTTAEAAGRYFYSVFIGNSPSIESTIAKAVKTLK